MSISLKGKSALVTGSSRGIGRAMPPSRLRVILTDAFRERIHGCLLLLAEP